jgi:adenylate cyclase
MNLSGNVNGLNKSVVTISSLAMQLEMVNVNQKLTDLGLPTMKMGIGINTGDVLVGNIGSKKQSKWTVIGSNINLASRIESYTIGGQVLISEATLQEAGVDLIDISSQQSVQPKETQSFIKIYEVVGIKGKYWESNP